MGGVVDQHVQATQRPRRVGDRFAQGGDVAQVAMQVVRRLVAGGGDAGANLVGRRILDVDEGDPGALGGEVFDDGSTDAACPAGYQHAAPAQARIDRILRVHVLPSACFGPV